MHGHMSLIADWTNPEIDHLSTMIHCRLLNFGGNQVAVARVLGLLAGGKFDHSP